MPTNFRFENSNAVRFLISKATSVLETYLYRTYNKPNFKYEYNCPVGHASPCIGRNLSRHSDLVASIEECQLSFFFFPNPERRTQYPRMIPLRNPHSDHISLATSRKRLSNGFPYWPCIRTLNISTGLARIEFAAPAMAPAAAVSFNESCPNGEMIRFEMPYAAKSSELTPAIPRRGLAIPSTSSQSWSRDVCKGGEGTNLCRGLERLLSAPSVTECPWALSSRCSQRIKRAKSEHGTNKHVLYHMEDVW